MIIVPALNYPAFRAGTRTSPIDKGNMNRSFPGRPDGTVTEKIADYVTRHLMPLGGHRARLPFGRKDTGLPALRRSARVLPDKTQEARCFEAVAPSLRPTR
jgi:N-alpha-acetyl-L-2,4-diaminobutyrate deacetylase